MRGRLLALLEDEEEREGGLCPDLKSFASPLRMAVCIVPACCPCDV
jgi:hypothetical protein